MIFSLALGLDLRQPIQVPEIASVAGMVVGQTTIGEIESRLGKGRKHTGGHPNGAREWYDASTHALIDADGFFYSSKGEVVDTVSVEWMDEKQRPAGVPVIRIAASDLGILAKLKPGMLTSQIEGALHIRLKSGSAKATGLIKYSKPLGNKDSDRFTVWEIAFGTKPKSGLQSIMIHGD